MSAQDFVDRLMVAMLFVTFLLVGFAYLAGVWRERSRAKEREHIAGQRGFLQGRRSERDPDNVIHFTAQS